MSSNQDTPKAKFYTYIHVHAGDGGIFYVGKGKAKRAWKTWGRSQFWKNVVAKHGYRVQILATWEIEEDAFEHEKFLIACFRDMGYPLVNLTDGGDGVSGWVPSAETKERLSAANSTPEARAALAERNRQYWSNPEARAVQAERNRQRWSDPKARQAQAERTRQRWSDPEARARFSGESNPSARLSDEACRQMFILRAQGLSQRKIAAQLGCDHKQVSRVLSGKQRRNIYLEFHPDESKN